MNMGAWKGYEAWKRRSSDRKACVFMYETLSKNGEYLAQFNEWAYSGEDSPEELIERHRYELQRLRTAQPSLLPSAYVQSLEWESYLESEIHRLQALLVQDA